MPKHDFEFEVYDNGDYKVITVAKGYDPDVSYNGVTHDTNWWVHLLWRDEEFHLDVQIGNHNAVLMEAQRDGLRGVDEDELEVNPIGSYRIKLLAKAVGFVRDHETRIIYAMEWLYQESRAA